MSIRNSEGTASLDKALDLLDAIGNAPRGLSQAELAAQCDLPKTTVYRLLASLVARGLLRRDPLRRVYCLGFRCFEYARQAYAMPDLVAAAGAELRALRDLTGETSYLAALDGLEVVSLERCDGAHSQRSAATLGQRKPLHCTSQGKALLAALPAARRDALIREIALPSHTTRTITDRRRLQAELKVVAARGYAIDDEEIVDGMRCCGAAIVDAHGEVRGAISVAGPAFRLTHARVELLGPELVQAARRIGAQLDATRPRSAESQVTEIEAPWSFAGDFGLWHGPTSSMVWADRLGPTVHRLQLSGALESAKAQRPWHAPADAPLQALLYDARSVLVNQSGAWLRLHPEGHCEPHEGGLPRRPFTALCVAPDGALWACEAGDDRWRVGEVQPDGGLRTLWHLEGPATALAWMPDGRQLCAITPHSGEVLWLRPGQAIPRRITTIPKGSGQLSGLALDEEGGVWTGLRDGWSVVRIAPDGALDQVIGLPVPCPTSLAFGGPALDVLFVLTSRETVSLETLGKAPLSGRVFAVKREARGVPATALAPYWVPVPAA